MSIKEEALAAHERWRGKIEISVRASLEDAEALSLAYTPGVAQPCLAIAENPELVYAYTRRWNQVAVVSDGTAVLGLGDIGPLAGLPVMEGKAALFKAFGGVDAFPVMLDTKDVDAIVDTVARISPTFGGINLEDISAPRCFEIERRLKDILDIPVFHDDQHGTAIVVLAALNNALRITGKRMESLRVVICGAGAAGIATARLLLAAGAGDIVLCDRGGALHTGAGGMNEAQAEIARVTNRTGIRGALADALRGADVFVGVSAPGVLTGDMVRAMNRDAAVFAMANPTPEIEPAAALAAGARIVGTGRSDYDNQINNVLAFPGVFRGALDARAGHITEDMKLAAARAIAALVSDAELNERYILPRAFDRRVPGAVAEAVRAAAYSGR